jgi:hypothetical protein
MEEDRYDVINTRKIVNGRWEYETHTKVKKHHPQNHFFKYHFTKDIIVYALIEKNILSQLWLESSTIKEGIMTLYGKSLNYERKNHEKLELISKRDLINLMPKEIQREIILNSIL